MEFFKKCFFYVIGIVTTAKEKEKIIINKGLSPDRRDVSDNLIKSDYYLNLNKKCSCDTEMKIKLVCGMPIVIMKNTHP